MNAPAAFLRRDATPIDRVRSTFDRAQLSGFIEVALALLDLTDGDPDVESNGDELDGTAGEDDFYPHSNWLAQPGCSISDPDACTAGEDGDWLSRSDGGAGDPEHHNIPATSAPTDPAAQKAKLAFESKCLACHSIAGGDKLGPDLYGVTQRHDDAWLTRWLKSPDQMLQSDATAKALLDKWKIAMPNQGLGDEEIKGYLAYFKWADQNLQPKGKTQPQPSVGGSALPPSRTQSATPMPGMPSMSGVPAVPGMPGSSSPEHK